MLLLLKKTIIAWLLAGTFGRLLGVLLAILLPFAGLLKIIGLPILLVMLVIGAPVILLLLIIGLPIALVAIAGIVIIGGLMAVLTLGLALLKVALPIILVIWLLRFLWRMLKGNGGSEVTGTTGEVNP